MEKTCGVFLFNKDGKFLICRPTHGKVWSIPKGLVDIGESNIQAAFRELKEETSIDINSVKILELRELIPVEYKTKKKILYPFIVKSSNSEIDFKLKCESFFKNKFGEDIPEVCEYRWVTFDECKHIIHESQFKVLINSTF